MNEKHQRKKRNFLLNQELQGKFIFKTFVIFILSAVGFTVFLALMTYNSQTMVYEGIGGPSGRRDALAGGDDAAGGDRLGGLLETG